MATALNRKSSFLLLITLLISIPSALAQLRSDLRFFDRYWNPVERKEQAQYYRKIKDADSVYHVTDYYVNDTVLMEGFFSTISPVLVHHGKATWYYSNGQIQKTGYFRKGNPVGIHKTFYENGGLKSEILHDPNTEFHLQYFDENGNALLKDGFGSYQASYMGQTYINEVFDGQLLRSYYVNTEGDTVYGSATKPAQFIQGGMKQVQKNIAKWVRYPEKHKKNGNDGTVMVSFVIDRRGNMTDVRTVNSLGLDFDRIAVRVVQRNGDWRPAQYNGKPVPMRFVVPVPFLHQTREPYMSPYHPYSPTFGYYGY